MLQVIESYRSDYHLLLWSMKLRIFEKYGSQKEFANVLGIDSGNLSKILTGVTKPSSDTFFIMLRLLDFSINL